MLRGIEGRRGCRGQTALTCQRVCFIGALADEVRGLAVSKAEEWMGQVLGLLPSDHSLGRGLVGLRFFLTEDVPSPASCKSSVPRFKL